MLQTIFARLSGIDDACERQYGLVRHLYFFIYSVKQLKVQSGTGKYGRRCRVFSLIVVNICTSFSVQRITDKSSFA